MWAARLPNLQSRTTAEQQSIVAAPGTMPYIWYTIQAAS